MDQKTVRIAVAALDTTPIDQVHALQGDLKFLSDEAYAELKSEILNRGFSFALALWRDPEGKLYLLDGHQRVTTLLRMRGDEGYEIPPLPYTLTEAATYQEAALKLLGAASQYGKITYGGLKVFTEKFDLRPETLAASFRFPEIDLKKFVDSVSSKPVQFNAATGSKELDKSSFQKFDHKCPRCSFEYNDAT